MEKRKTRRQTRSPRHRLVGPIEVPNGRGLARNISNSGLFFELAEPLELGRTLHVSLILNDLHPMPPVQLEAAGRVVRVERLDGKAGIAIRSEERRVGKEGRTRCATEQCDKSSGT